MTKLNTRLLAAGTMALLSLASTQALAQTNANKKYCLNPSSGGSSCSFTSMEQCWETMRGRNGWCSEQVDFEAWAASHGGWYNGGPEGAYASYPRGGGPKNAYASYPRRRMPPADADMEKLHKDDMPSKGVGAE